MPKGESPKPGSGSDEEVAGGVNKQPATAREIKQQTPRAGTGHRRMNTTRAVRRAKSS